MADLQSDLIGFEKDLDTYAPGLAGEIAGAAESADSEPDFRQQIRDNIEDILDEFNLEFDYVDSQIGDVTKDEILERLSEQGVSLSNLPYDVDEDDLKEGGAQPDAVINACALDYKAPGTFSTRSGKASGLGQIISYMVAVADVQHRPLDDTVGVILDGEKFIFVHGDDFAQVEERPINDQSVQEFAALLVGQWTALTARRLTSDFGNNTQLSTEVVGALFEALKDGNERSERLFEEWQLLFEQVCGFDFDEGKNVLGDNYNLELTDAEDFRLALFALYTYYALIAKLIAAEFVYYHSGPSYPSFLKKLVGRPEDGLREQMESLEDGWMFADAGITNFLEASLFSWYVDEDVWNEDLTSAMRSVANRMRKYDPGKLRDDPQETRDVFKKLYQHMVPEKLRKQLGEVFTPDWLADLTMETAGYNGEGSMLDPACGSGTFLVYGVKRKKEYYGLTEQDIQEDHISPDEIEERTQQLLSEIEGFDLNPLAVLASRANLLIELGELIDYCQSVELPVYLSDSVRPPESGDTLTGSFYKVKEVPTNGSDDNDTTIRVPKEIIQNNLVNDYFEIAKGSSESGASPDVFLDRFEHIYDIEDDYVRNALKSSYEDMHELRERDVNGIWWEIVKNRFRPRFTNKFDFILGNPPYITLGDLPSGYRDDIQKDWENYGIAPIRSKTGPRKNEHALLFVAKSVDSYLKEDGTLSFIMPHSVQRGGKGDGFRKFIAENTSVTSITDVADLEPFDVSRNRVLILTLDNGDGTDFPRPCETWIGDKPDFDAELEEVRSASQQYDYITTPLEGPEGKWFAAPEESIEAFKKVFGEGDYDGHAGIYLAGGTGLFLVDVLNERTGRIRNTNQGRTNWGQVSGTVDKELLFPATSGEDVHRWEYKAPDTILVPHKSNGDTYTKDELRSQFSGTYDFLYNDDLNKEVGDRKLYGSKLKNRKEEEHYLHAVGARMFNDYKIVYKDISGGTYVNSAAATLAPMDFLGEEKPIMFTHTLMHISADSKEEAYYLSGVLNSSLIRAMVRSHSTIHANPRAIEEMNIPTFDISNDTHAIISELAEDAHQVQDTESIEKEIDELVGDLFDISDEEIRITREYLENTNV